MGTSLLPHGAARMAGHEVLALGLDPILGSALGAGVRVFNRLMEIWPGLNVPRSNFFFSKRRRRNYFLTSFFTWRHFGG